MFAQLKNVVDLIRSGISDFRQFKDEQERRSIVTDILKVYFLLKDCIDDGEKLIHETNGNPIKTITALSPSDAKLTAQRWDMVLRKQGVRLHALHRGLFGQHHLAIINPSLQEKLNKAIGNKMDNVVTLHGIGAGLFFNMTSLINETPEEKAKLIEVMAGAEAEGQLDMKRIQREILDLRDALEQYHSVVARLVSDKEILAMSKIAREQAQMLAS